ncbi:MAG: carboxyl transferase domain-containing protein, partial [Dehalococcoidia bacterium]
MKNRDDLPASPVQQDEVEEQQIVEEEYCLFCGINLTQSEIYHRYRVCPECRFHHSLPARQRIDLLADTGSFKEVNRFLSSIDPLSFSGKEPYGERILEAQLRTGLTEAVITGVCTIGGNPTAIAVLDFGFMGGNMGGVVGEKVALAFELAARRRIPMVTVISSGGARVQEGVLSLMQMAKTAAA